MSTSTSTDADERGTTLIEVIITLWILGAVIVVAVGALFTIVRSSDLARRSTQAEAELRQYTEYLRSVAYKPCASAANYTNSSSFPDASTTAVHFWNNAAEAFPTTFTQTATADNAFRATGSCTSGTPADNGLQKLDVGVTVTGSPNVTLAATVLKRDNGTGP